MKTATEQRYSSDPPIGTLNFECAAGDPLYFPEAGLVREKFYGPRTIYFSEITPNSTGGRHVWKDFEHYKVFSGSPPTVQEMKMAAEVWEFAPHTYVARSSDLLFGYDGYAYNGVPYRPYGDPGMPSMDIPGFYEKRSDGGFVPPPGNLDDLATLAYKSIMPSIKAELSLVNSTIELKDFVSLPQLIRRVALFGLTAGGYTLRELARLSAEGYLQYKFNLAPLVSDIAGIFRALSTVERRINDLVTRVGKVQRRHWVYNWNEFPDVNDESDGYSMLPRFSLPNDKEVTAFKTTRRVVHQPSKFHAEIEYNYNFTQYQVEHARILALLDAFGVNLNPAIIWNAIPWSFVVDWVIGVGRWLDNFKVSNMEPKINILRFLWSVTRVRDTYLTKKVFNLLPTVYTNLGHLGSGVALPVVREVAYRRSTELPSTSSLLASGLSSSEFSLAAALVIARRRRSKRR